MNIETYRAFCLSLPGTTEDVKWGHDLCFSIGGKMYSVTGLGSSSFSATFRVQPEEFEELAARPGIVPAPYLARHHWVQVQEAGVLTQQQWEHYLRQSYTIIKAKLPKKVQQQLAG